MPLDPAGGVMVVLTTLPEPDAAAALAERLLEERLIACANVVPGVRSIYRWEGETRSTDEVVVVLKTTREAYGRFEARLLELHPYDVPEVLALPVSAGYEAYLSWVHAEVGANP